MYSGLTETAIRIAAKRGRAEMEELLSHSTDEKLNDERHLLAELAENKPLKEDRLAYILSVSKFRNSPHFLRYEVSIPALS